MLSLRVGVDTETKSNVKSLPNRKSLGDDYVFHYPFTSFNDKRPLSSSLISNTCLVVPLA
jgi:hypothetical protein